MNDSMKAFWLGLFIVVAVGLLTWFLLFLRPTVGDAKQVLRIRFSNIEKINVGTRVTFAGRPVGEVVKIDEIFDARNQPTDENGNFYFYEVVVRVDSKVKVYPNDEILFSTQGLMGEKTIAIVPKQGPTDAPQSTVLYARSSSQLDDTLDHLRCTLDHMDRFFDQNTTEFYLAMKSFRETADLFSHFIHHATELDVPQKLATALTQFDSLIRRVENSHLVDNLATVTGCLVSGEGTFGKVLVSDCMYGKLCGTLTRFEILLDNLNNYGLLYQFSNRWQKQQAYKATQLRQLSRPCDYYNYFNQELHSVSSSLDRVDTAINKMECQNIQLDNPCLIEKFQDVLNRVESLRANLKLYNEFFLEEYTRLYNG